MPILYNITVKINHDESEEWKHWMENKHIPDVLKTGMFETHRFCKLLNQDETEGLTYAIQYVCKDMKTLQQYSAKFAPP